MNELIINFYFFSSTSKERQKRFDAIINLKRGLVEKSVGQNRATLSIALQESENHVRQLVEENAALNEIMKNSKEQIYETLRFVFANLISYIKTRHLSFLIC